MYNSLTEAIINIGKPNVDNHNILYTPWSKRYSKTMKEFYDDFIKDRLPEPAIVMQWHDLLVKYAEKPGAIFPIRAGNTSKRLRRGWLVRCDDGFSYMFTDNDFAVYIYKMALDGYCPSTVDEFYQFMTEFVDPNDIEWLAEINKDPKKRKKTEVMNPMDQGGSKKRRFLRMPVHFNPIGGSGLDKAEDEKNAYINSSPAPACCLGKYNYKHAHLVGVAEETYDIHGELLEFEKIKEKLLGDDLDYQWNSTIDNYVWERKISNYKGSLAFNTIKEVIKAQFFRFLDPLNHFLAPKAEQNKYTRHDSIPSLDIAEYQNLQKYILDQKESVYQQVIPASSKTYFEDYKERVCASDKLFSITVSDAEAIEVVYHEKSLSKDLYKELKKKSPTIKFNPHRAKGGAAGAQKTHKHSASTEPKITLIPSDEESFKKALLLSRKARRTWKYDDGTQDVNEWEAKKISATSHLKGNIRSSSQWKSVQHKLVELVIEVL